MTGYKTLSRMHVRKRVDRAGVITLSYDGRLPFVGHLYGHDEGVFFALAPADIPIPDQIEQAAAAAGMIAADHPDILTFKRAVAEALLAQAVLGAPNLLEELVDAPTQWTQGDRHELERRHARALVTVEAAAKCILDDLRRRALLRSDARTAAGVPAPIYRPAPAPAAPALPPPIEAAVVAVVEEPAAPVDEPAIEGEAVPVSSAAVERASAAIAKAREAELPQRLPGGARRQLAKLPPGTYIIAGDLYEPRKDLASAMTDAQEIAHRKESVVVDWDGEYPVVVRRYGPGGRVVYRVETALRRAASEEAA